MGFFDRLSNAWKIFKLSFNLLSRDKSLMAIPILMILSSFILIGFLVLIAYRYNLNSSNYLVFIIFLFVIYFIMVFLSAAQSWMVYEVLQGINTTVSSGFKRAFRNFGDILAFVFTHLVIIILTSFLRRRGGIIGRTAGGTIDYLAGLAGKLVLPAMIITERNFKESVMQLKDSIRAIPEIATFEIGIRPLTVLIFFIGFLLEILLIFSFGFTVGIIFIAIWFMLMILLSIYVNGAYYTILYLTLIEKKKIKGLNISLKPVF